MVREALLQGFLPPLYQPLGFMYEMGDFDDLLAFALFSKIAILIGYKSITIYDVQMVVEWLLIWTDGKR